MPEETVMAVTPASFGSLPSNTKRAMVVARRWQGVPNTMTDEQALAQGIITPEMLELIMSIVMELMTGCLSNSPLMAWKQIRAFTDTSKELDRIGDKMRLNGVINRWVDRLGIPRDRGDVVAIRRAITEEAEALKEKEFQDLQNEMMFLAI